MPGSTWRKWDLHFHTPSSYDYENKSITDAELIGILVDKGIQGLVVTDHHFIDVKRIKNLQSQAGGKLLVLPGIEFRAELGGSDSIHFIGIFPEDSRIDEVWTNIQAFCELREGDIVKAGGDEKIHCDLKETCNLIHKEGGIVSIHAGRKTNSIERITNTYPYKQAIKEGLLLNHIDILELGQVKDSIDYTGTVFPSIKKILPLIICSDNHNVKSYSVKENLWLKSDLSFNGLKQITYEPKYRVHIGPSAPMNPLISIHQVTLTFPDDTTLAGEPFCLRGPHTFALSPNFTCFIGGRGTGKSTILNLLHEKLKPGQNNYFKENHLLDSKLNPLDIKNYVSIDGDSEEKYVEFLSQNEIEVYAQDHQKLTNAIYLRILKRDSIGTLAALERTLIEVLKDLKIAAIKTRQLSTQKKELENKRKELASIKTIIESFSSAEYLELTQNISNGLDELEGILRSKEQYSNTVNTLNEFQTKNFDSNTQSQYSEALIAIQVQISNILSVEQQRLFDRSDARIEFLRDMLTVDKGKLATYLTSQGLREENLHDVTNASEFYTILESEIKSRDEEVMLIERYLEHFQIEVVEKAQQEYRDELRDQISNLSKGLEMVENVSIKPISLTLGFDLENAMNVLYDDFRKLFEGEINKSKSRLVYLRELLFYTPPEEIRDRETFLAKLRSHSSVSEAKQFLLTLFENEYYFKSYWLLTRLILLNSEEFKQINVFYDKRAIGKSSFGQRCTAVLVILLQSGNNPIMIDEPEAHLDSYLIANYLTDIIKNTKQNRQVIFATHNANFVINGDAELIHILEQDEKDGKTKITSTTIENPDTRSDLVALEGGIDAFRRREQKYH